MLVNLSNQAVLAADLEIADSFWRRFCGLMGRRGLGPGKGLVLKPCNSVHTWFMRFSIDVLFLDRNLQAVHIEKSLLPFRFSKIIRGAVMVVELPPGTLEATRTKVGDYLEINYSR
ncbi:MAG: DUF192 domain-containing protein [Clostridia bacterium]|nr:DUF192 domain-containing protein [Clostridia bacterium]